MSGGGQIVLALTQQLGGWPALRILRAGLAGLGFVLLLSILRRAGGSRTMALCAAAVLWPLFEANLTLRPHLFGWILFLTIVRFVLLAPIPWATRRWGLFTLLTVVWVNLHSSALLLPCLLVVEALGCVIEGDPDARWRRALHWLSAAAVAGAACLAQPAGWRLLPYAAATPGINLQSDEWRALLTADVLQRKPWLLVSLAMLAAAVVLAVWLRRRTRERGGGSFPAALTCFAVLGLALWSRRMTLFVVPAAVFAVRWVVPAAAARIGRPRRGLRRALQATVVAAASVFVWQGALIAAGPSLAPGAYPVDAARFLAASRVAGRAYAYPDWGGYLGWKLHPAVRVFIDGRWVLVGKRVLADSVRIAQRTGPVEELLDRYGVDVFVEPIDFHLSHPALATDRWLLAYRDPVSVVLLRRGDGRGADLHAARAFYAAHPGLEGLAHWPQVRCGGESPPPACAIASVLDVSPRSPDPR